MVAEATQTDDDETVHTQADNRRKERTTERTNERANDGTSASCKHTLSPLRRLSVGHRCTLETMPLLCCDHFPSKYLFNALSHPLLFRFLLLRLLLI